MGVMLYLKCFTCKMSNFVSQESLKKELQDEKEAAQQLRCDKHITCYCVCEVGTFGKISDCQPAGLGFNPRPVRGLNFWDVKPLV